jgi:hypothetical protein
MEQIFYILISICCCMGLCGIYKCFKPNRIKIHNNSVDIEEQTNTEEQTIKRFHSEISDLSNVSGLSDLSMNSDKIKENDCRYSELV